MCSRKVAIFKRALVDATVIHVGTTQTRFEEICLVKHRIGEIGTIENAFLRELGQQERRVFKVASGKVALFQNAIFKSRALGTDGTHSF